MENQPTSGSDKVEQQSTDTRSSIRWIRARILVGNIFRDTEEVARTVLDSIKHGLEDFNSNRLPPRVSSTTTSWRCGQCTQVEFNPRRHPNRACLNYLKENFGVDDPKYIGTKLKYGVTPPNLELFLKKDNNCLGLTPTIVREIVNLLSSISQNLHRKCFNCVGLTP